VGSQRDIAVTLLDLAILAGRRDDYQRAAHVLGGVDERLRAIAGELTGDERAEYDHLAAAARSALGEDRLDAALRIGRHRSLAQLLALPTAAGGSEVPRTPVATSARRPQPLGTSGFSESPDLTPRERDVLRLVAAGLKSSEVAARLVVSPVTVNAHLRAIYGKLGVSTRSAATRYALDHGLA